MGVFSSFFTSDEKVLSCDWCKKEMISPSYTKSFGKSDYGFCSESCKKEFRIWYKKVGSCGPSCGCN